MQASRAQGSQNGRTKSEVPLLLGLVLACGSLISPDPLQEVRCPTSRSEFPPVACALLRGVVRDSTGRPLPGLGIRVDSFIPMAGYIYSSSPTTTDPSGSFSLKVNRQSHLILPASPDTASVEVKFYKDRTPLPHTVGFAARLVRMSFAPLGALVDSTIVEFLVPRPPP